MMDSVVRRRVLEQFDHCRRHGAACPIAVRADDPLQGDDPQNDHPPKGPLARGRRWAVGTGGALHDMPAAQQRMPAPALDALEKLLGVEAALLDPGVRINLLPCRLHELPKKLQGHDGPPLLAPVLGEFGRADDDILLHARPRIGTTVFSSAFCGGVQQNLPHASINLRRLVARSVRRYAFSTALPTRWARDSSTMMPGKLVRSCAQSEKLDRKPCTVASHPVRRS